jgi:hypothetical protein
VTPENLPHVPFQEGFGSLPMVQIPVRKCFLPVDQFGFHARASILVMIQISRWSDLYILKITCCTAVGILEYG